MNGGQTDEELARLAAGGDERAFSDLYNRYFPEVYDYAIRISRDRDIAALVLQSSFLRLHQALQAGTPPPSVKLQLFAGAHHDLAERVRRRLLVVEGEEAFVAPDPDRLGRPVAGPELHELTRLAWQASRELRPEDYELLDLSVRRGLSDEEIAMAVRTRPQAVQSRLDRARATFEDSFSSLLLLSYGRRACLELDFLVAEDKWSSSLRRRIFHHLTTCSVCQGTRRAYPSAADALGVIAVAPAPPGWQAIMLSRLLKAREDGEATPAGPLLPGRVPAPVAAPVPSPELAAAATPARFQPAYRPMTSAPGGPALFDRFSDWSGGRGPLVAVFGGGLLIVLMIFGGLCASGALNGGGGSSNDVTTTPTRTVTATRTRTPTVTPTLTPTETPPPAATPTEEPPTATRVPTNTPLPVSTNTPPPAPTSTPVPSATP